VKDEDGENPAIYFIGIMPFAEGFNTMMVSITLTEASKNKKALIINRGCART
jgi:hypothetical protein